MWSMIKTVKLSATDVEDEVLKSFKRLMIARYGSLRGHMGKALTEVMMLWTNREGNEVKGGIYYKR
jgi:hypothetical protein